MSELQQFINNQVPEGWTTKPFWSMFRRVKYTNFPDEELLSVYRDYGVIPKSSRDDNHNKASEDLSNYQLIDKGWLVTNKMKAWQGSIAISRHRGIVSPAYYAYKPLSKEHDQFLHYLLRSDPYIALYKRISKGVRVNQWDLEHDALRTAPILLPPYDVQKEIADFLDQEAARVDSLIEKKNEFIEILNEKKNVTVILSCIGHMGLEQKPSQKTSGNIVVLQEKVHGHQLPSNWNLEKIHHVFTVKKNNKNTGLINENLLSLSHGKIIRKNINRAEGLTPESYETYQIVDKGDIVLRLMDLQNDKNSIRQGLVDEAGIVTSAYDVVSVNEKHNPKFWAYTLLSLDLAKYYYSLGGGVRQSIKFKDIPSEWVLSPNKEEQERIANQIDQKIIQLDAVISKTKTSISDLKKFKTSLITEAVTGQLDIEAWKNRNTADRRLDKIEEEMAS